MLSECWKRLTKTHSDVREPQPASCVFCAIAAGQAVNGRRTALLHEDAHVVAFTDRSPAAAAHILVCPRDHIVSARHLRPESGADVELGAPPGAAGTPLRH